jgi:hypothetical protein
MFHYDKLKQWIDNVSIHFPKLSKSMATGLALWSFGMIIAKSCSLSAVATALAPLMNQPFNTVRERLRDTYREADAKSGDKRAELDVASCWAPWLTWILEGWEGTQLAIAMDATTLGNVFIVLAISVVYRGCSIPIAWKILKANEKHPWKPEWEYLLKQLKDIVPKHWTVIVLADRGLYARWLFEIIVEMGWHPLLRVNVQGSFRPEGWFHWKPFKELVPAVGKRWQGRGTAFTGKKTQLNCTLLGYWGEGHADPWLILTDLDPAAADACWYGLRAWIERGFKHTKSGGWQWQYTRMTDPKRAERLWMAIALATWWLISVGGDAEANVPVATVLPLPGSARKQNKGWRLVGIFQLGMSLITAALLRGELLFPKAGRPEPWPKLFDFPVAERQLC